MSKEKDIQETLKNIDDTATMIRKFLNLVKNHASESNDYLSTFKNMYSDQPYYSHVKESILDQVDVIGVDVEVAEHLLN